MQWAIYGMVYLGSALMVYNVYAFIRFALKIRVIQTQRKLGKESKILYIPIVLLVLFLLGYLAVGIFGEPDLIVSGILFGGSIFVFVIYLLLSRITQQIMEGESLRAQLIAAEESNKTKSSFLASVSHEMRTPMNVIIGLDSIALGTPNLPAETKGHLEKIGASAKHLLGLINNILDINSMEAGTLVIKKKAFPLCDALEQVNAIVATLCDEKGLTYRFSASDCAKRSYIGDELQLKNVLLSILDNAVKYTNAPGTVELSVQSAPLPDPDGEKLIITVSDSGVGIDSAFLPKVFDIFTKEDLSSTDSHGGSGLSLAVTKNIVEQCGGTISVSSEKNVGSVFTVILPMQFSNETDVSEQTADAEVSLDGRRILIAEDLPENAEIVADLLELEGVISEHAENGQVALDMFKSSSVNYYDAILMDLRMPVMDGLTATREIRKLPRDDAQTIPIIALTANAFESDVRQALDVGMNAHLAKPTDANTLYTTLKTWIAKKEVSSL